jgi:hypothetical protein
MPVPRQCPQPHIIAPHPPASLPAPLGLYYTQILIDLVPRR